MTLALALSGGGSYGIRQAGMLKYLAEQNIKPDIIFGTSVGAINGSLFAQGDIDLLEKLWLTIKSKDVYYFHWTPTNWFKKNGSFFSNKPLRELLTKYGNAEKLKASGIKVYAQVTNTETLSSKFWDVVNHPNPIDAIISSTAIPVIFPPEQGVLVDGGLSDNYGIEVARRLKADKIILFACNQPQGFKNGSMFDALQLLFYLPMWSMLAMERIKVKSKCDTRQYCEVIPPPGNWGLLDFDYKGLDRKALIKEGYELAKKQLNYWHNSAE